MSSPGSAKSSSGMRLLFVIGLLAVFGVAALTARTFPLRARIFPLVVALTGVGLTLIELIRARFRDPERFATESGLETRPPAGGLPRYLAWIAGFYLLVWLVGFVAAAGMFVAAFLRVEARASLKAAVACGALTAAALLGLSAGLGLRWVPPLWVSWTG